jgi:hypothetical protein
MAQPHWFYRDPAAAYEHKEQYDCHGCKHKGIIWGKEVCVHPDVKIAKLIRCHRYEREVKK